MPSQHMPAFSCTFRMAANAVEALLIPKAAGEMLPCYLMMYQPPTLHVLANHFSPLHTSSSLSSNPKSEKRKRSSDGWTEMSPPPSDA